MSGRDNRLDYIIMVRQIITVARSFAGSGIFILIGLKPTVIIIVSRTSPCAHVHNHRFKTNRHNHC